MIDDDAKKAVKLFSNINHLLTNTGYSKG